MKKSRNVKNHITVKGKKDLDKIVKIFSGSMFSVYSEVADEATNNLLDYILDALDSQRFKWKALNPKYKKSKERKGLSTDILMATKEYRNSIQKIEKKGQILVGVPNKIHKGSGLKLDFLAKIHEYGSKKRNIPSRQLWRPAASWFVRQWKLNYTDKLIVNLNKKMEQKTRVS